MSLLYIQVGYGLFGFVYRKIARSFVLRNKGNPVCGLMLNSDTVLDEVIWPDS